VTVTLHYRVDDDPVVGRRGRRRGSRAHGVPTNTVAMSHRIKYPHGRYGSRNAFLKFMNLSGIS
jgi:hypothetical protein